MNWTKIPSVTTGGKPHYYRSNPFTIVWDRAVSAYALRVDDYKHPRQERTIDYFPTPRAAMNAAEARLKARQEMVDAERDENACLEELTRELATALRALVEAHDNRNAVADREWFRPVLDDARAALEAAADASAELLTRATFAGEA